MKTDENYKILSLSVLDKSKSQKRNSLNELKGIIWSVNYPYSFAQQSIWLDWMKNLVSISST